MKNARLDEAQPGIKGEISITSDMQMTTLMAESEEELKSLLMKVKEESGKNWLKAQHSENKEKLKSLLMKVKKESENLA